MPDTEERLEAIEQRLGAVETSVTGLSREVGELRGEVGDLREKTDRLEEKTDSLATDVQKLRVLGEENQRQLQLVAEVQVRHGEKLERIEKALEPLGEMHALLRTVTANHEGRLIEVEKRVGIRP